MKVTNIHILLVEDNTFDAKVFCRALDDAKLEIPITVVGDGIQALALLRDFTWIAGPGLVVVTDLNIPRMNGIELLRTLRGDAAFEQLPVFVVTTSDAPADREKALELGIEGYICKTGEGRDLIEPIIAYLAYQERCAS
jgi:CheY-like chemotaxis protein